MWFFWTEMCSDCLTETECVLKSFCYALLLVSFHSRRTFALLLQLRFFKLLHYFTDVIAFLCFLFLPEKVLFVSTFRWYSFLSEVVELFTQILCPIRKTDKSAPRACKAIFGHEVQNGSSGRTSTSGEPGIVLTGSCA